MKRVKRFLIKRLFLEPRTGEKWHWQGVVSGGPGSLSHNRGYIVSSQLLLTLSKQKLKYFPTINYLIELDNNFLGPWLLILAAMKPGGEMFLRYYPIRILRQDQLVIDEEISQCEKTKVRHHCWDIWRVFSALFTGTWSHCWTSRTFLWRRTDINIFTDLQDKPWNPHIKQRRWNIIRWLSAGFGTDFPQ